MPQLEFTADQAARLAPLIARFRRGMERQQQRDGEITAALIRALRPGGARSDEAEQLRSIIRQIASEELTC